jgi:hypothetical protein
MFSSSALNIEGLKAGGKLGGIGRILIEDHKFRRKKSLDSVKNLPPMAEHILWNLILTSNKKKIHVLIET